MSLKIPRTSPGAPTSPLYMKMTWVTENLQRHSESLTDQLSGPAEECLPCLSFPAGSNHRLQSRTHRLPAEHSVFGLAWLDQPMNPKLGNLLQLCPLQCFLLHVLLRAPSPAGSASCCCHVGACLVVASVFLLSVGPIHHWFLLRWISRVSLLVQSHRSKLLIRIFVQ